MRLSLQLIVKRHLPEDAHQWSHEKIIEELNKITHLRLDRENISEIDNLELLGSSVTNVYLQENQISVIQNLDCLQNLQFLTLAGNQISKLENLKHLSHLLFLDLSNNSISHLDTNELPLSLIILNLTGNSCCSESGYRASVLECLKNLKQLDLEEIDGDNEDLDDEDDTSFGDEESNFDARSHMTGNAETAAISSKSFGMPHKNKLPDIDACLQTLTAEVLLRSQNRLEESLQEHRHHRVEIDNLRMKHCVKPASKS